MVRHADARVFAQAGLKTGMYYLRTRAAADAIKFTVDQQAVAKNRAARQSSSGAGTPAPAAKALPVIEAPIGFTPTPELKVRVVSAGGARCGSRRLALTLASTTGCHERRWLSGQILDERRVKPWVEVSRAVPHAALCTSGVNRVCAVTCWWETVAKRWVSACIIETGGVTSSSRSRLSRQVLGRGHGGRAAAGGHGVQHQQQGRLPGVRRMTAARQSAIRQLRSPVQHSWARCGSRRKAAKRAGSHLGAGRLLATAAGQLSQLLLRVFVSRASAGGQAQAAVRKTYFYDQHRDIIRLSCLATPWFW